MAPEVSATPEYHFYHEAAPTAAAPAPRPQLRAPAPPVLSLEASQPIGAQPSVSTRVRTLVSEKFSAAKTAVHSIAIPKLLVPKLVGAGLAAVLFFTVPGSARTYYEDLHDSYSQITQNGLAGFQALEQSLVALTHADIATAQNANDVAIERLGAATGILKTTHPTLQTIAAGLPLVGGKLHSGQEMLLAGQELSLGNSYVLAAVATAPTSSLLAKFNAFAIGLRGALPHYTAAQKHLSAVDPADLPTQYQSELPPARALLTAATHDLQALVSLQTAFQEIFGGAGQRRYLLVFQNQHEMRPTGGFLGSVAIVDVKDGAIIDFSMPPGGTYDFQGQLDSTVVPPTPMLLANKRWEFQDANWFPDFPTSAQNILWFYRHSRGVTADGVIAINASVLEQLLALTGPVALPDRGLTLTADNALEQLQTVVETGPEKAINKPKQILSDTAPLLLQAIKDFSPQTAVGLLNMLAQSLDTKDIQAYFIDPLVQASVQEYGWAGQLLPTNPGQDYLSVINTNIKGGKSDRNIAQSVFHQVLVQEDGSIIDTVDIVRTHHGTAQNGLYGLTNIDYVRLYVPEGSQLLSASGFNWPEEKLFRVPLDWAVTSSLLTTQEQEVGIDQLSGTRITREFGKYAFGNWVITEPGQTSHLHFTYRLPFKAWDEAAREPASLDVQKLVPPTSRLQVVVQRQSGQHSSYDSQVILPDGWQPAWHDGPGSTRATNGLKMYVDDVERDTVWSLAFTKNK